ncbi:heterokaryon incompatibility protein-domain-containing protein, partial [Hyaloscypha finlandica]
LVDFDQIRKWLFGCRNCVPKNSTAKLATQISCQRVQAPLYLIDCFTRTVVPKGWDTTFWALSYVWGGGMPLPSRPLQKPPYSLPTSCPRTIEDAITITRRLSIRYLWVDQYCIDETDSVTKHNQIAAMDHALTDQVYDRAQVTIVTLTETANDCIDGVSEPRNSNFPILDIGASQYHSLERASNYQYTEWHGRAWTYQEYVMSSHCVFFGREHVTFQCRNQSIIKTENCALPWKVDTDSPSLPQFDSRLQLVENAPGPTYFHTNGNFFFSFRESPLSLILLEKHVRNYTGRTMTYDSDSLNAIMAILERLSQITPGLRTCCGIPYYSSKSQEYPDLSMNFTFGLCWSHGSDPQMRFPDTIRRPQFPSWSWIGWGGAVAGWLPYPEDENGFFCAPDSTIANLEDVKRAALEDSSGTHNSPIRLLIHTECWTLTFKYAGFSHKGSYWENKDDNYLEGYYLSNTAEKNQHVCLHLSANKIQGQDVHVRLCSENWIGVPLAFSNRHIYMMVVGKRNLEDQFMERFGCLIVRKEYLEGQYPKTMEFWIG